MHFLEKCVLSPKLGFLLLSPLASLGPTCSNLLFCSQLDLSDAKQLRSLPLREKKSFFFKSKNVSFPHTSMSYIISQQTSSPHD